MSSGAESPAKAELSGGRPKGELLVPIAVVVANVAGVAVALLAPSFLPPAEYSVFALTWAVGQFLAMLCFEWLRIATLRFGAGQDEEVAAERRTVISATYRWLAAGAVVLALVTGVLDRRLGEMAWLPFAIVYAVCQGTFDGRQAFARARRDNFSFARDWALRAVLCIASVVAAAWMTRNGRAALLGLSLSFPMSLLFGMALNRGRVRAGENAALRWKHLPRIARYGSLAAISGVIAFALPTLLRWALVAQQGKEGAAGALLAADLAQKALSVAGLAVNMVMMQNTFAAIDSGDAKVISQSNQRQIAWAFAVVVPLGLLFWLLGNDIANVLMKPAYRVVFAGAVGPCALGSGLICLRLFAIDPLFYGYEKPAFAIAGAAVSLLCCLAGVGLHDHFGFVALDVLTVFWVSAGLGLLVSAVLALGLLRVRPPWSELFRVGLAGAIVVVAGLSVPALGGLVGLVLRSVALGTAYVVVTLLLDIVGLRSQLKRRLIKSSSLRNG